MRSVGGARMSAAPALVAAAVVATFLVATAAVFHLSLNAATSPLPDRLVPVLMAAALLLVGLLALPQLPGLAWATVALAAPLATLEIIGVIRSFEAAAGLPAWRELVVIAAFAVTAAAILDGFFGLRRPSAAAVPTRLLMGIVAVGVVVTIAAAVWAVAEADKELPAEVAGLTPLRIATRTCLVTVTLGYLLGVARALGPAAARAADRATRGPDRPDARLWAFLGFLADELLPSRTDARHAAAEAERARLAADLHAHVLPELRRLAAAAQSAGAPENVQVDLRRALEDVEQLMHQRQSIVLEQFGLVAALEWLAERTEERSPVRVHLELGDAVPDGPGAIEPGVARAAFRIALLALDNVVRHAGATTATIRLAGGAAGLGLTVEDDGAPATLETSRGRGLADMRTAAAESGGDIRFVGDAGARVEATWPIRIATRNHAPAPSVVADRSEEPIV